jgi:hypothetical protein
MTNDTTAQIARGTFSNGLKSAWMERAQEYVLGVQLQMMLKAMMTRMNWGDPSAHGLAAHPRVDSPCRHRSKGQRLQQSHPPRHQTRMPQRTREQS